MTKVNNTEKPGSDTSNNKSEESNDNNHLQSIFALFGAPSILHYFGQDKEQQQETSARCDSRFHHPHSSTITSTSSPIPTGTLPINNDKNKNENEKNNENERDQFHKNISSLNFERVINDYSIRATLESASSPGCNNQNLVNNTNDENAAISDNHNCSNTHQDTTTSNATIIESTATELDNGGQFGNSLLLDDDDHATNSMRSPNNLTDNIRSKRWFQFRYTELSGTRWFLSAMVGLLVGLLAIVIVASTEYIVSLRMESLRALLLLRSKTTINHSSSSNTTQESTENDLHLENALSAITIYCLFTVGNLILATIASFLCVCWVPQGAGSGIPQIMAYLNGVRVCFDSNKLDHFASMPLLMVKMVGTVLSVSSFLAIGMEGPLIHIGAIVGCASTKIFSVILSLSQSKWFRHVKYDNSPHQQKGGCCRNPANSCIQGIWSWATLNLSHFATDYERRDLVSIGASCGFAASFGAPIGGLLYILDDLSSYLSKDIFLRTLVANAVGTFCMALHHGSLSNYSIINLGAFLENASYLGSSFANNDNNYFSGDDGTGKGNSHFAERFAEVPLYMLVGAVGGIMGGIFCYVVNALHKVRKQYTKNMTERRLKIWSILEVMLLSILTSTLLFFLPAAVTKTCKEAGQVHAAAEHAKAKEPDTKNLFFCQNGEINEMSTLLLGSRSDAIKRILTQPSSFETENLFAVGILFYVLMTLTFGVMLPSGIFTPAVMTGASLGGVAGIKFQQHLDEDITPSTFALLGVAAFLAGVQRSTVSLCIILVEGTGQVELLIPVIITVIVARYFSTVVIKEGIFELVMKWKQYPFLNMEEKPRLDAFQVKRILQRPVITVNPREKAHRLVTLLRESPHNGFPVVDEHSGQLLGLIRRDQIVALLEFGVFDHDEYDNRRNDGNQNNIMMHLAYHIKDDRYEDIDGKRSPEKIERKKRNVKGNGDGDIFVWHRENPLSTAAAADTATLQKPTATETSPLLQSSNERNGKRRMFVLPSVCQEPLLSDDEEEDDEEQFIDSSLHHNSSNSNSRSNSSNDTGKSNNIPTPTKIATVRQSSNQNNLYISWLDAQYRERTVPIGSIMNQGVYCVTESCPISKARSLFTGLGLRHVVVLGGPSGGQVVGILTRASFLDRFIREKTGA